SLLTESGDGQERAEPAKITKSYFFGWIRLTHLEESSSSNEKCAAGEARVSTGALLVFSKRVGLNSLPANVFVSRLLRREPPWLRKRGVKSEGETYEKTVVCLLCVGTWVVRGLDRVGAGADYFGNCARRRT